MVWSGAPASWTIVLMKLTIQDSFIKNLRRACPALFALTTATDLHKLASHTDDSSHLAKINVTRQDLF